MGQTLQAAVAPGLALAGLLAVTGLAAGRFGRSLPHLGIGAVGVAVAAAAGRLTTIPSAVLLVVLIVGGAAAGAVAATVDDRARRPVRPLWPPPLLPDVAVLGLAVSLAAILRPPLTVDLPVAALGGFPPLTEGVLALGVGFAGAAAISARGIRDRGAPLTWAIVGAVSAVAAVLGSGGLVLQAPTIAPVFAVVDVAGLGLRAAAVGVVARHGAAWGVAAAVLLGVGEALLTTHLTVAHAGLAPAVVVLVVGLWDAGRAAGAAPAAEAA